MKTTRRDLFKFAAGGTAGLLFTPAPWRLITDAALWSENWPGIPRPARGDMRCRFTHCTLCPAGCAVRARCIGSQPIALDGLAGAPLCAFGLTGHHLPYHEGRVKTGPAEKAAAAVARRGTTDSIAVLDLRPGRTASWTYRRAMASVERGLYLAPQTVLPAVNLRNVKTILSFGVPVLDGWGTPATVLAARSHFRLIQAEPAETHTAMLADLWLPIRLGADRVLSSAILSLLRRSVASDELRRAAERTGLPESVIVSVARDLAQGGGLVLAVQEFPEMLELNAQIGAFGRTIVGRREAPVPAHWKTAAAATPLDAVPDRSIGVLLIDESVCDGYFPWNVLEPKLATRAVVVTFASSPSGYGQFAQFTLPSAVYPEATDDLAAAIDSLSPSFRLSSSLVAPPPGVLDPAHFVARVAGLRSTDTLRERADAICESGRGVLRTYSDEKEIPVKRVTPDAFWKALNEGARWEDSEDSVEPVVWRPSAAPAPVVALTWEMRGARRPLSPVLSKLYQESNLRVRS